MNDRRPIKYSELKKENNNFVVFPKNPGKYSDMKKQNNNFLVFPKLTLVGNRYSAKQGSVARIR